MEFQNIKKVASIVKTGIVGNYADKEEDFISFIKEKVEYSDRPMFAVAYMDNGIFIEKLYNDDNYNDNRFKFYNGYSLNMKYLQKIRIFNENEELSVWRTFDPERNVIYRFRHISDSDINNSNSSSPFFYCKDVNQMLFGTYMSNKEEGYVELKEDRGVKIIMPDEGFKVDADKNRIAIKTRNYIDFGRNFIASYIDARFLKFIQLSE